MAEAAGFADALLAAQARFNGRRRFFGAVAAVGAAAVLPGRAAAQAAMPAGAPAPGTRLTVGNTLQGPPSRFHPSFVKDVGRLQGLNPTNQGGAYWNFDTYITPVEDFYIRNAFPTPRPELDRRVDPRFWRLKIHGDAVERELEIGYDDLLRMPSRSIISLMQCAGNGRTLFWEQQDMLEPPAKVSGNGWGLGGIGLAVNRHRKLTPYKRPILTLSGVVICAGGP